MRLFCALILSSLVLVAGCTGAVIHTLDAEGDLPERFDGMIMNYYLSRGELKTSASYDEKTKLFSLNIDKLITALPDFNHKLALVYRHEEFSIDEVNVQLDGGMLKKVSSTTTDQTVAAVTALNALLGQIGAVQGAIAKTRGERGFLGIAPLPDCPGSIKVSRVVDVTYETEGELAIEKGDATCRIELRATVRNVGSLGMAGYPKDRHDRPQKSACDQAVCFRVTGSYKVEVTARLIHKNGTEVNSITATADVLAPHRSRVGFVRFNRRRFVANSTSITFTNGMLSEFSAKDPSEVVGFFSLPTEVLKGVVLTVPLVK